MALYLTIFVILSFLSLIDLSKINKSRKLTVYWLCVVGLVLVSGLRWRTGADWSPYFYYFKNFRWGDTFSMIAFEPAYVFLTFIVKYFTTNYTFQLLALAILTIGLRGVFIKKHVEAIFVALLLFWGNNMAEIFGTRQALAISICLLSIPFIQRKQFIKFSVIVIIAMLFHSSAILFFAAYLVYYAKWNTKTRVWLLIMSIFLGLSGAMNILLDFLSGFGFLGRLSEKSDAYANLDSSETAGSNKMLAIATGLIKRALMLPIFFYFENKIKNIDNRILYKRFMNLFVFGNMIYFMVIDYLATQRMAGYFYPFEILLWCLLLQNANGKAKTVWWMIIVLYALIKLLFIINGSEGYILPYYWIFSDTFWRRPGLGFDHYF